MTEQKFKELEDKIYKDIDDYMDELGFSEYQDGSGDFGERRLVRDNKNYSVLIYDNEPEPYSDIYPDEVFVGFKDGLLKGKGYPIRSREDMDRFLKPEHFILTIKDKEIPLYIPKDVEYTSPKTEEEAWELFKKIWERAEKKGLAVRDSIAFTANGRPIEEHPLFNRMLKEEADKFLKKYDEAEKIEKAKKTQQVGAIEQLNDPDPMVIHSEKGWIRSSEIKKNKDELTNGEVSRDMLLNPEKYDFKPFIPIWGNLNKYKMKEKKPWVIYPTEPEWNTLTTKQKFHRVLRYVFATLSMGTLALMIYMIIEAVIKWIG